MTMKIVTIVVALGLTLAKAADPECGLYYKDWSLFEGHCYTVQGRIGSAYTWHYADKYCRDRGAQLASVHSDAENAFLAKDWLSHHPTVWLGLNAIGDDTAYTWTDGTKVDYARVNVSRVDTSKGRCAALSTPGPEKIWYLMHCETQGSFACKRPQNAPPVTIPPPVTTVNPGNCPESWTRIGNKCFKVFSGNSGVRVNHSTALGRCKSLGPNHDLASVHNTNENIILTTLVSKETENLWIGLSRITFTDFGWTDNTPLDFTNWAPGEPSSVAEGCTEFITTKQRAGLWNDISCRKEYGYICQRNPDLSATTQLPPPETCSQEGFFQLGSSCFKIFSGVDRKSWLDAEKSCSVNGGHLASVHSKAEMAFLKSKLITDPQGPLWLGLSTDERGQLQWSDHWPVTYFELNASRAFKPSACAVLNENFTWSLINCSQGNGFMCKISTENPPDYPEVDLRPCPTRVPGLLDVGLKNCFAIRRGSSSWGDAYHKCLKNDSSLVSFHHPHELELLSPYFPKSTAELWIGIYRKYNGSFVWVDGSKTIGFDLWDAGEPANKNDCVGFSPITFKLKTHACNDLSGYICSYPKGS